MQFQQLARIDIAIAPGNRAERGLATLRAVLSYTGHAITVFRDGRWTREYGWMSARRQDFGRYTGKRWLANVDVPDLEIFPQRYAVRQCVRFQAGLELTTLHFTMVLMAQLCKWGLVKNWSHYTNEIFKLSAVFNRLGTDVGMRVQLIGVAADGTHRTLNWVLSAKDGIGPYIPTLAAVIVVKKILANTLQQAGARPCVGMFSLPEFDDKALPLGIVHGVEFLHG